MTTSEKRFFYFSVFLHCQYCPFAATCCKKTLCLFHFKQLQYLQAVSNNTRRHIHTHRHAGTYIPIPGKVTVCWQRQYIFSLSIKNQSHPLIYGLLPSPFPNQQLLSSFQGHLCKKLHIQLFDCHLSKLWPKCTGIIYSNCTYQNS